MSQRDAHESYAVAAGRLHWIAAIMAAVLVGIVLSMYLLFKAWVVTVPPEPVTAIPPAPRLQSHPTSDLASERARENAALSGYRWADRDGGVAIIPIDRAMQLLAQPKPRHASKEGSP